MRLITFKIDETTLSILDKHAIMIGKSRSEVIRNAIKFYLLNFKEKTKEREITIKKVDLW